MTILNNLVLSKDVPSDVSPLPRGGESQGRCFVLLVFDFLDNYYFGS